ncbi:hypothetical protein [Mumia sp. DW29H23]|uniref:hypothetical protein n=1 Tax=Mumia sp. DW29H23 TaxID=3421241 RepID=UPI003D68C74B
MDDGQSGTGDTQWTREARTAYQRRAEEFIDALRAHVALTSSRSGRHAELASYVDSTDALRRHGQAFEDAELDWCGSIPLGLPLDEVDEIDEEDDGDLDDEVGDTDAAVLTLTGTWEFRVADGDVLVREGREAYARSWPHDTAEDAERAVTDPMGAVVEVIHAGGPSALENLRGLDTVRSELRLGTGDDEDG